MSLSQTEKQAIKRAIEIIATGRLKFTCHAIAYAENASVIARTELIEKYTSFYEKGRHQYDTENTTWGDLPSNGPDCTFQSQLQRQLMLELFLQLDGEV